MGHTHGHGAPVRVSPHVQRRLLVAVVPFALATVVGLIALWPSSDPLRGDAPQAPQAERLRAVVTDVSPNDCQEVAEGSFICVEVEAEISGTDDVATFTYSRGTGSRAIEVGDRIIMARPPRPPPETVVEGVPPPPEYYFVDFERERPLILLAVIFAIVVVALSRWRGLMALIGIGLSILVLTRFVLPAILEGSNPLLVAIVGAAAIMFVALYLAHGVNARTTTAVLGTLASLALTGVLSLIFVHAAKFTGLASEEATFLQVSADQINLGGLLLGGIVIGALGVLDDVTVTQASAVWELHAANPEMPTSRLYRSAIRIGRDHIASTVNTLFLAYAGASLPLLILFTIANQPLGSILTTEVIAEELVRTFVGSIGLVASVPITTALAAAVVAGDHGKTPVPPEASPEPPPEPEAPTSYRRPRAEEEWRR